MIKRQLIKEMDSDNISDVVIPHIISGTENNSSLLLEAARRYDHKGIVEALLSQENGCNVQHSDGRSALHILLEDGFMGHLNEAEMNKCVRILIDHGIDVNMKDHQHNTPLSLAVFQEFSQCTSMLLNAGAHCPVELATKIAHCMPTVLLEILDNGISIIDKDSSSKKEDGDILVKLDWRPILQFPQILAEEKSSFRDEQKETQFLYNILDTRSEIQERFLYHPLVQAFVFLKNARVAAGFWLFFAISFCYPILYGVFIWFLYFERCKFDSHDAVENDTTVMTTEKTTTKTHCEINAAITVCAALLLVVNASWTFLEIYMLLRVDMRYLTSWRSWILRVAIVIMGVTLWPALFYQDGYNLSFQYPIASLGIFLSWVLFLMQMSFYKKFSIYLEMLVQILLSVLKIIILFLPLFCGFYMGFNLLFSDMDGVFDFIMMTVNTGSTGYDQIAQDSLDQAAWFRTLANIFSVAFLIIIVIVFMNFLLALSIRDVEILKGKGKLASISRMVQNLFVIDLIYPNSVLITKEELRQGKHYFLYDPRQEKQELPEKIRMRITLFLKERNLKNARKQELNRLLLRAEGESNTMDLNNDMVKVLLKEITDLESKVDILNHKFVKASD